MYRIDHVFITTNDQGELVSGHSTATVDDWEQIPSTIDTMLKYPGGRSGTTVSMSINLVRSIPFDF